MNPDIFTYFRVFFAFTFVVGLIYISGWAARKWGLDKKLSGQHSGKRTLMIAETLYLDQRRKLVLIKTGNQEHVVLLGSTQELLIESRPASQP